MFLSFHQGRRPLDADVLRWQPRLRQRRQRETAGGGIAHCLVLRRIVFPRHLIVVEDDQRLGLATGERAFGKVGGADDHSMPAGTFKQIDFRGRDGVLHHVEANLPVRHAPVDGGMHIGGTLQREDAVADLLLHDGLERGRLPPPARGCRGARRRTRNSRTRAPPKARRSSGCWCCR